MSGGGASPFLPCPARRLRRRIAGVGRRAGWRAVAAFVLALLEEPSPGRESRIRLRMRASTPLGSRIRLRMRA